MTSVYPLFCVVLLAVATTCVMATCNDTAAHCFPPEVQGYLKQGFKLHRMFNLFRRDLGEMCTNFTKIRTCMEVPACNDEPQNFWKQLFDTMKTGFHYVCDEHKQDFDKMKTCMAGMLNEDKQGKLEHCSEHIDPKKTGPKFSCSEYNGALACVAEQVTSNCGADAASKYDPLVRIMTKSMAPAGCTKDSAKPHEGHHHDSGAAMTTYVTAMLITSFYVIVVYV